MLYVLDSTQSHATGPIQHFITITYSLLIQLQLLTVPGGHQLHMYNASVVSEPINTFLSNAKCSKL